jgi:protein SCO1/2
MLRFVFVWILGVLLLVSCKKPPQSPQPDSLGAGPGTNLHVFVVKGIIKAIKPAEKEIEIKHEAIPDYMPAMTMPFDVKDTNELAGLLPEQPISFRLTVTDTEGWVDKIQPLGPPRAQGGSNASSAEVIHVVEPLQIGEPLPDYPLTNQLGQLIKTSQFKGQALAITFLFTRCPFPTFCPRLANDFEETQQKMLASQNAPTNWHLLTVSFDPDFDRPEVLKSYAEAHRYDPEHWTFATGKLSDISSLGDLFGLVFARDSTGSISHNMRIAIIDANGKFQKLFEGTAWTTTDLLAELVKAARTQ